MAAAPKHHILDNEFSEEFKRSSEKYDVTYEKVPPNIQRRNSAERAVRTFKSHLLAGLASIDSSFPINQWDQLLEQAEITLNLLHVARVNPRLSAYAYLFGNFDFNKTPLAPPGTKVAVHIRPGNCPSWGYHVELGYYVGPAMEYYRCFKCFIPATGGIRVADTIKFFPHDTPFPKATTANQFIQALSDILHLLKNPNKELPFMQFGDNAKNAITHLVTILKTNLQRQLPTLPQQLSPPWVNTLQPQRVKKQGSKLSQKPLEIKCNKMHQYSIYANTGQVYTQSTHGKSP